MIEIHCHILPKMDDGPQSLEDSIKLAELACSEGIHTIIATPHHGSSRYNNNAIAVRSAVDHLNELLQQRGIPLSIRTGQEIRLRSDFLEAWDHGELLTLSDSRYILLELSSGEVPSYLLEMMHEIQMLDLVPVIAHPERHAGLVRSSDLLEELVEMGVRTQVTAHSIVGIFGKQIQRASLEMCRRNLVHFVACDAHHPVTRPFGIADAYAELRKKFGEEVVSYYQENTHKLIHNEIIPQRGPIVHQSSKRSWFWSGFKGLSK